jgi:hypothetical protein
VCALEATGLLGLSCLQASGGPAGGIIAGGAELLGLTSPLAAALDPVAAFAAEASSGTGTDEVLGAVETPASSDEAARTVTPAAASPSEAAGQGLAALPRTGVALAAMAAMALTALLGGAALRILGRRRVTA